MTVVVGPNGSGKSNVADAIVWAAGSLAPSELRAEKPDDVLFNGSGGRPAASSCEVELLLDNEDGDGPLEFSDLSVMRRLHRGGEGQYLVNRAAVRRLDLVELLADLGLGTDGRSIVGQGRVEEILASRPEERRALIEEAAGLGSFKRRRHRAELKLARVATEIERALDLEAEVRSRLRPLALQATAAERAERLAAEAAALRARIAAVEAAALEERLVAADEQSAAAALARRRADLRLEALVEERARAEDELADAAGRREAATAALYRLRGSGERLALRTEALEALLEAVVAAADESARAAAVPRGPSRVELGRAAAAATAEHEARSAAEEVARTRLGALERALAEREGVAPAARALAEAGERLAVAELEVEPGDERAVAAALAWRASALVADNAEAALGLVERARAEGLGSVVVAVAPGGASDLLAGMHIVEPGDLLSIESGIAVTRDGLGYDPERGVVWFAGEAAEAVLLELEARRRELRAEVDEAAAQRERAAAAPADARRRAAEASESETPRRRGDPRLLRRIATVLEQTDALLAAGAKAAAWLEAPLRARVDAGATRAAELAGELRRLAGVEAELRREAAAAGERTGAIEVERARIEAELAAARERAGGVEAVEDDDGDALAARLERVDRRLAAVGPVNPLAKEEYERERGRLAELEAQRADVQRAAAELEQLRADLAETVERRFEETLAAVRDGFAEVAATLFPGGEGRLRLTDPDEEDGPPGVEIELRPAGKRVTRLSLLSGGERSLGAIAFLFALFLARPCPFYLLDEVEAALDDANIGRFVEVLRRYADRAQFVVITHQKRTMEAADVLYGVTMGGDGISQVVSRRLPQEDRAAAVA